jgi:hypothetical protein
LDSSPEDIGKYWKLFKRQRVIAAITTTKVVNRDRRVLVSCGPVWDALPEIVQYFLDSDGTLAPALEPNRAAAVLASTSKILPVVAPIPPAQFNPGNTIKWNKVL